jgi:hypothetical protein
MNLKVKNVLRWVVFAAELLIVASISFLLILLFLLVVKDSLYTVYGMILLVAGTYGLAVLWWMLFKYGPMMKEDPPPMNLVAWLGWVTGMVLAVVLIVATLREKNVLLTLQSLAYFSPPIAISLHMLIRYRRARQRVLSK